MFEKEAEEYCTHQKLLEDVRDNICKAFQDGAEFGYNKCFEQVKKLVNESTRLDCIIPELLRLQEI